MHVCVCVFVHIRVCVYLAGHKGWCSVCRFLSGYTAVILLTTQTINTHKLHPCNTGVIMGTTFKLKECHGHLDHSGILLGSH